MCERQIINFDSYEWGLNLSETDAEFLLQKYILENCIRSPGMVGQMQRSVTRDITLKFLV
uniref:Uncharacterized protein n=1 Tax=Romanomermis culicivorax TaxID=13658 RepID=A0A915IXE8_ROMCU